MCDRQLTDVRAWWSPAAVDPLLQVRPLGPDRGVEPVAGQHQEVGGQGEEPTVDGLDDLLEVTAGQRSVPRAAGEEGVAAEQDRVALEQERRGAGRVAGVVDRPQ